MNNSRGTWNPIQGVIMWKISAYRRLCETRVRI